MGSKDGRWTRDQLIAALDLYCRTPFGRLHRGNPDVVTLAKAIRRTPSAVAMKLVNFASFDPVQQKRGIRGLSNAAQADREIWEEFQGDWAELAVAGSVVGLNRWRGRGGSHLPVALSCRRERNCLIPPASLVL